MPGDTDLKDLLDASQEVCEKQGTESWFSKSQASAPNPATSFHYHEALKRASSLLQCH